MPAKQTKQRVGIVVQARMGSSRCPGKVMRNLAGKPLLLWLLERLSLVSKAECVVVATSLRPENEPIVKAANAYGVLSYRGSEENILSRYEDIVKQFGFDHVVRCTADNPLHDPVEIDSLIQQQIASGADYSYNFTSLPKGIGADIFSASTIRKLSSLCTTPDELEHLNNYILKYPDRFTIKKVSSLQIEYKDCNESFSIDTPEDMYRIDKICQMLLRFRTLKPMEAIAKARIEAEYPHAKTY